jgi:hypothetical protein
MAWTVEEMRRGLGSRTTLRTDVVVDLVYGTKIDLRSLQYSERSWDSVVRWILGGVS